MPQWSFGDELKWLLFFSECLERLDVCAQLRVKPLELECMVITALRIWALISLRQLSIAHGLMVCSGLFRFVHGRMDGRVVMCQHDSIATAPATA